MRYQFASAWPKYAVSAALVGAAVSINILLTRWLTPTVSPLLFAAVLVAAWQGGWGPGLLATILAALSDDYFFIPPVRSIDFQLANIVRLAVFIAVSLLTSGLTAARSHALEERDKLLASERNARASAEEANRIKDRFLAFTSHELRTPLSAIVMWGDLLAAEPLSDSVREGIESIQASAAAQRRLIEDLLDIERLRTGKLRLDPKTVDLSMIVRRAMETMRLHAVDKRVELIRCPDNGEGLTVNGDPGRLEQIVTNLLANAIKFTPSGGRVEVTLEHDGAVARLRVSDTGRGIRPQDLPHVFDCFWQAGSASTSSKSGLGLGLAIVLDLVRLHGGQIRASSDGEDRGATFVVELPLLPTMPERVEADSARHSDADARNVPLAGTANT